MKAASAALVAITLCGSLLTGCKKDTAAPVASIQPPAAQNGIMSGQADSPLEDALRAIEEDPVAQAASACSSTLAEAVETVQLDEIAQAQCATAVAGVADREQRQLVASLSSKARDVMGRTLALEMASQARTAPTYLDAAAQLLAASGDLDAGFERLDVQLFSAGYAATMKAADAGSDAGRQALDRLEDIEFPLAGAPRLEPLWRALYFGHFEAINDTIVTRRHIGAMAYALIDLAGQWEPPGIRSVELDAALETYLAPVRAQVLSRAEAVIPHVLGTVSDAVQQAQRESKQRSLEAWIEAAIVAAQSVKRQALNSVAVGTVEGRDAAQVLFTQAPGCRSYRGLKFIAALLKYLRYAAKSHPADAGSVLRSPSLPATQKAPEHGN